MPLYNHPKISPGDPVLAERFNEIEEELKRLANIRGSAGVDVRRDKYGIQIAVIQPNNRYLAVADGDIPPRSGTTAGAGTVNLYLIDSGGTITSTGQSLDVWNPSDSEMSTGVSILDGLYCWVHQDVYGTWIVAPLECPPP